MYLVWFVSTTFYQNGLWHSLLCPITTEIIIVSIVSSFCWFLIEKGVLPGSLTENKITSQSHNCFINLTVCTVCGVFVVESWEREFQITTSKPPAALLCALLPEIFTFLILNQVWAARAKQQLCNLGKRKRIENLWNQGIVAGGTL